MGGQLRSPAQLHPCRDYSASGGAADCDGAAAAAAAVPEVSALAAADFTSPASPVPSSPT